MLPPVFLVSAVLSSCLHGIVAAPVTKNLKVSLVKGQVNLLKKVLDSIGEILTEATWDCSEASDDGLFWTHTGLRLQGIDSRMTLVSVHFLDDSFDILLCGGPLSMGTKLSSINTILGSADNNDFISLKYDGDKVIFVIVDSNKLSKYAVKLIDRHQEDLHIPPWIHQSWAEDNYAAVLTMPSSEFQRIAGVLSQLDDSLIISCTKEAFKFSVNGELGSGSVELAETANVAIKVYTPITYTFDSKYLSMLTKASAWTNQVRLTIMGPSSIWPLMVEYSLGDTDGRVGDTDGRVGDTDGRVRYFLRASRPQSDSVR